jgi:hypothetical protein
MRVGQTICRHCRRVGAGVLTLATLAVLAAPAGASTLSVLYQASSLDGGDASSLDKPLPLALVYKITR